MRYLSEHLIKESFLRLQENESGGKIGTERTSALMGFLAFDALLKRTSITPPVDLDPENGNGKTNRDMLTREFVRLVQLKNGSEIYHVQNLGVVTKGGTAPEKRFSSNFLTTGMKKATTNVTPMEYPGRPCPLLILGTKATGLTWGINRYPNWEQNLPEFLKGRKSKTPFHDLAIFVLRQRAVDTEATELQQGILDGLAEIFTSELCTFWKKQISLEKVYFPKVEQPFQDMVATPFNNCAWLGDSQPGNAEETPESRIAYLEGLLRMHHIPFDE